MPYWKAKLISIGVLWQVSLSPVTSLQMLLANQSHGQILDYEVTWAKATERERQNRTTVAHNNHSVALSVDTNEDYIITVTARNINGSSTPSTITIPSLNSGMTLTQISLILAIGGIPGCQSAHLLSQFTTHLVVISS